MKVGEERDVESGKGTKERKGKGREGGKGERGSNGTKVRRMILSEYMSPL